MPRKSDAKDKLIRTAARLFRQRGYHAVGLTEILEESGAPKGSFYHHFPEGKDQLAEHCLLYSSRKIEENIEEVFKNVCSFEEGITSLASYLGYWFAESEFQAGCPIATVILETTPQSPRIQKTAQDILVRWTEKLAEEATGFGEDSQKTALEKAEAVLQSFEGAWVIARIRKSQTPFMLAAELCIRSWRTHT